MHLLCLCENVYQQTVVFFMGFSCAPDLADFLYSYEADFIQAYLQKKENKLARPLNITIPYDDAVMSLNDCKFCDFFYLYTKTSRLKYFILWFVILQLYLSLTVVCTRIAFRFYLYCMFLSCHVQ
jgi:hypothetical protein